jgi:putative tricarboxylic transport membrane protein
MKFNDIHIGIVLGVFSVIVFAAARTFPVIPGQQFGASLFPMLIAVGLFICALLLVAQGLRARAAGAPKAASPSWLRDPISVMRFLMVPASLVFYFVLGDWLGFVPCAFLLLIVLFRLFGVRWRTSLVVALATTLIIHFMFYTVLHVPLPWGLLEPVAW